MEGWRRRERVEGGGERGSKVGALSRGRMEFNFWYIVHVV